MTTAQGYDDIDNYIAQLKEIDDQKMNIIQKVYDTHDEQSDVARWLCNYIFVSDLDKFQEGRYIRWIKRNEPNAIVSIGAFFCRVDIGINSDIYCVCKTKFNRYFSVSFNTHYIFQKITKDEIMLNNILRVYN